MAVLRRVRHPSIIQLIEVDETPSQLFLVMELVKVPPRFFWVLVWFLRWPLRTNSDLYLFTHTEGFIFGSAEERIIQMTWIKLSIH